MGLLAVIAFPKHDWSLGPQSSGSGTIHRIASVVAFVCLPICVLLASKVVFPRSAGRRLLSRGLAVTSLLWFGVILGAVAVASGSAGQWWAIIPLGLVERGMALTGVLALVSLILPLRALPVQSPLGCHQVTGSSWTP